MGEKMDLIIIGLAIFLLCAAIVGTLLGRRRRATSDAARRHEAQLEGESLQYHLRWGF